MIYTARKNGYTRTFSDVDGKLLYYRRNRWQITAQLGRLEVKPHPAPRVYKEKPDERRERRFTRIMGYRVVID